MEYYFYNFRAFLNFKAKNLIKCPTTHILGVEEVILFTFGHTSVRDIGNFMVSFLGHGTFTLDG
jgi:hypothetical protein